MIPVPALTAYLARYWNVSDVRVTVHHGGMGSATWIVNHGDAKRVAKLVALHAGSQFAHALELASQLERSGIPAGAPVPAMDGSLAVDVGTGWLALLGWVPGDPLTGRSGPERELIGNTLGTVHRTLTTCSADGANRFHWVDPGASYLHLRPWLRPAISAALDALEAANTGSMTWGLLHADPAPDAFRLDPETRRCGVIDWSYFLYGPLLYDLASAVMYVGGAANAGDLVDAYLRRGLMDAAEIDAGLGSMLRFRWAVQANYFAWRIAENDLTGVSGPLDNENGLEDARRALAGYS
ncbi:MAG: phosphotransferase enzyme family protein [Streptosporangiaceae bacterium]